MGELVTMDSCPINAGKTRKAKPQDPADLVSKGDGSVVDNTWQSEGSTFNFEDIV